MGKMHCWYPSKTPGCDGNNMLLYRKHKWNSLSHRKNYIVVLETHLKHMLAIERCLHDILLYRKHNETLGLTGKISCISNTYKTSVSTGKVSVRYFVVSETYVKLLVALEDYLVVSETHMKLVVTPEKYLVVSETYMKLLITPESIWNAYQTYVSNGKVFARYLVVSKTHMKLLFALELSLLVSE